MRKAFTLIELLVVIAIIATLVGILIPVTTAVKKSSSRAISAHSLHQLGAAGQAYLNDNDAIFWPYNQYLSDGTQWWFGFETWASSSKPEGQRTLDLSRGPLGPYAMAAGGVKTDPTFLSYSPRLKPKYQNGNFGYGYNTLLPGRNVHQIDNLSQIIVFATCAQVNTFQPPASAKNPMVEEFYMINDTQVTVHFRHGGQALAAFLDGSVRELPMAAGTLDTRLPSAKIGRFAPAGSKLYLQ